MGRYRPAVGPRNGTQKPDSTLYYKKFIGWISTVKTLGERTVREDGVLKFSAGGSVGDVDDPRYISEL